MKLAFLFLIILFASGIVGQDKPKLIGEIEFFGTSGIDVNKLRAALPFHEQDRFTGETFAEKFESAGIAVKQVTNQWPTDLTNVCCDERGNWVIFIGLAGKSIRYNPPPKGQARLPQNILNLYDRFIKVIMENVQQGAAAEEYATGYALSAYAPLRSIQLEMRAYALRHETLLREVLANAADEKQRIVAAEVRASRDSVGGVRNNATRALIVLAESNAKVAGEIPAGNFIELLLSGAWTDLNKAGSLLDFITKNRNEEILRQLRRREVLDRLIEIARWRSHGTPARYILGRIAGIEESRLKQLVAAEQLETIIDALPVK